MELSTAKNFYFTRADMLNKKHEELATTAFGFKDVFRRTRVVQFRAALKQYYEWLHEYDSALSENISLEGENYELQSRAARAQMTSIARSVYVSSIESYEKELSNVETALNFRLTTAIAVVALVVSLAGV